MPVRWVIFDAGETLIDETPHYQRWADWLGVPRDRFMAALIATIAAGEHHHRAFEAVLSGIDLAAGTAKRRAHFSHWTTKPVQIITPACAGAPRGGPKRKPPWRNR